MIRKMCNQKEILTPKAEVGKTKLTIRYFLFSYGPNYQLRIEIDMVRITVAEALNQQ